MAKMLIDNRMDHNPSIGNHYDEEFIYATVESGNLPIVVEFLKIGIDVNIVNSKTGLNLLAIACLNKYYEIVKNLLQYKVDVNVMIPATNEILENQFHISGNKQLSDIYDKLNYKLCNITCLHIAVFNSDPKMMTLLLEYGAKIVNDPSFIYIAWIARDNDCQEIVHILEDCGMSKRCRAQLFLDYKTNIQYIDPVGDTLLHKAIEYDCDVEFIKTLLELKLPVNAKNAVDSTPLHSACRVPSINQLEVVKTLLHYNADVNSIDNQLQTPLHLACTARRQKLILFLLQNGANVNAKNSAGNTPLHLVYNKEHETTSSIIELLLKHNANIEAENDYGETPIFEACIRGNVTAVKCLLDNHANVNAVGRWGLTCLHTVCDYRRNTTEIINLLLKYNANIEAVAMGGSTPLCRACNQGNDVAIKCLLDNYANVNHSDSKQHNPFHLAVRSLERRSEIMEMLLKYNVIVNCTDTLGNSIIHIAAINNYVEFVQSCADIDVSFNSVNKEGKTPLHIAAERRNEAMVESLIKYGANVNILGKDNQTCLQYIRKNTIYNKSVEEILKIEVVKLWVAGLEVNSQNLKIIYDPVNGKNECCEDNDSDEENLIPEMLIYKWDCEKEIKAMKKENIGFKNITFYHLLKNNLHFLCKFVKNNKIQLTLEQKVYDEKFPLYIDVIRNRFRDAQMRYRLMDSAREYFRVNINSLLPDECIDMVFSYLSINDLHKFQSLYNYIFIK